MEKFKISLITLSSSDSQNVNGKMRMLLNTMSEFYNQQISHQTLKSVKLKEQKISFSYTFDEEYSIHKHNQQELKFKMNRTVFQDNNIIENPYVKNIHIGSQLCFEDNEGEQHLFTVINIDYEFTEHNITYTYKCKDTFSYQMTRQNDGYQIDNDASSEDFIGPKNADWWIIKKIEPQCHLAYKYIPLAQSSGNHKPSYDQNEFKEYYQTITFSGSGNANSILISLAEQLGLMIKVYERIDEKGECTQEFWLEPEKHENISGLKYSPYDNINNFSLQHKGESLTTVMNVQENTYGDEIVSLLPTIPPFFYEYFISKDWEKTQYSNKMYSRIVEGQDWYYDINLEKTDFDIQTSDLTVVGNILIVPLKLTKQLSRLYPYVKFAWEDRNSQITTSNGKQSRANINRWRIGPQNIEVDKVLESFKNFGDYDNEIDFQSIVDKEQEQDQVALYIQLNDEKAEENSISDNYSITEAKIYIHFFRDVDEEEKQFAEIADEIPWLENKIIDFSYFYKYKIIGKYDYSQLNKIFQDDLRIINGKLLYWSQSYYTALHKKTAEIAKITNALDIMGANYAADIEQSYQLTQKIETVDNLRKSYETFFGLFKPMIESPLLCRNELITEYTNKYILTQQRFLKNIYNFRKYFEAPVSFLNTNAQLHHYNITIENNVKSAETFLHFDTNKNNYIDANGQLNTNESSSKVDENKNSYVPVYELKNKKYNLVTLANKNNYKTLYTPKDLAGTLARVEKDNGTWIANTQYFKDEQGTEALSISDIIELYWSNKENRQGKTVRVKPFYKKVDQKQWATAKENFFNNYNCSAIYYLSELPSSVDWNISIGDLIKSTYGNKQDTKDRFWSLIFSLDNLYIRSKNCKIIDGLKYEYQIDEDSREEYRAVPFATANNEASFFRRTFSGFGGVNMAETEEIFEMVNVTDFAKWFYYFPLTTAGLSLTDFLLNSTGLDFSGYKDAEVPIYVNNKSAFLNLLRYNKDKINNDFDYAKLTYDYITFYQYLAPTYNLVAYSTDSKYQKYYYKEKLCKLLTLDDTINTKNDDYRFTVIGVDSGSAIKSYSVFTENAEENLYNTLQVDTNDGVDKYKFSAILNPLIYSGSQSLTASTKTSMTVKQALIELYNTKDIITEQEGEEETGKHFIIKVNGMRLLVFRVEDYQEKTADSIEENYSSYDYYNNGIKIEKNQISNLTTGLYYKVEMDSNMRKILSDENFDETMRYYSYNAETNIYTYHPTVSQVNDSSGKYFIRNIDAYKLDTFSDDKNFSLPIVIETLKTLEKKKIKWDINFAGDPQIDSNNNNFWTTTYSDATGLDVTLILTDVKPTAIGKMTNGQFWFTYSRSTDPVLFEYAASIEVQLEEYWSTAYNASLNCKYFIPSSWQPVLDSKNNYFSDLLFTRSGDNISINSEFVPNISVLRVNATSKLPRYTLSYKNFDDDIDIVDTRDLSIATPYITAEEAYQNNEVMRDLLTDLDFDLTDWRAELTSSYDSKYSQTYYKVDNGGTTKSDFIKLYHPEGGAFDRYDGWYRLMIRILKEYYSEQTVDNYKQAKKEHDYLWTKLSKEYPGILLEEKFSNSLAASSKELLTSAQLAFKDKSNPERGYNIDIIDVAHLQGYKGQVLHIGDSIELNAAEYYDDYEEIKDSLWQYLFITDISYKLRESNINLTVNAIKYQDKLIQRLVKLIK